MGIIEMRPVATFPTHSPDAQPRVRRQRRVSCSSDRMEQAKSYSANGMEWSAGAHGARDPSGSRGERNQVPAIAVELLEHRD
ncbi:hypothetical protein, partial [Escherichia coli]|uniref:hypothetical protein n=1 Tax=Escherichia coli TaxID=562 RepID=UPI001BE415D7